MKKLFSILLVAAVAVVVSGCAAMRTVNDNTPHTTITGKICGQPFSIENPKDTVLEGLEVMANTNGSASIRIARLSTVMNPMVVTETGVAGDKLVRAGGEMYERGLNATANAAGKVLAGAAGVPSIAPAPTPAN